MRKVDRAGGSLELAACHQRLGSLAEARYGRVVVAPCCSSGITDRGLVAVGCRAGVVVRCRYSVAAS